MNYITALPDFIEMQRISFCWFISQGLNEELAMFSRIHDFSYNTEYVLFGSEYSLVKPIYNIVRAKKYTTNYSAQLVIPLEVRNKKLNTIRYHNQFPIINLPLMTTYATFIINGCERVIVSQIIRSPGIYFEKNKNQKKRKLIKRNLPTEINKLRSFVPLGESFLSEQTLSFLSNPYSQTLYQYSFNQIKKSDKSSYFYFLELFKIFKIISQTIQKNEKLNRIKLFVHWLNLKDKSNLPIHSNNRKLLIEKWNLILKSLVKYQLINNLLTTNTKNFDIKWKNKIYQTQIDNSKLKEKILNLISYYEQIIQLEFNKQFLIILINENKELKQINQFKFLNKRYTFTTNNLKRLINNLKSNSLKPNIYFSVSLKELTKYKQKKRKLKDFDNLIISKPNLLNLNSLQIEQIKFQNEIDNSFEFKYEINEEKKRIKYLKSRSEIIQYKEFHEIKDSYKEKYREKDFYTAILIPESGSWIRFTFQKNTQINKYKYPLKNQEDEVIIQLDKFTQKPVIHLLKEMGLTDLEICQNLENADFFYFNKPLITNSVNSNQPLLRFDLKSDYYKNISEFSRIFDNRY